MKASAYLPVALLLLAGSATASDASRDVPTLQANDLSAASSLSAEQVRTVQRSLTAEGFPTSLTGRLDDQTHQKLSEFQQAKGLQTSGALDQRTFDALGLDPRNVVPVRGTDALGDEEHGT